MKKFDETKRYNRWHVDSAFQFPWVYRAFSDCKWYFEVVLFHQCINFKLSKVK